MQIAAGRFMLSLAPGRTLHKVLFVMPRIADTVARPGSDWKAFEAPLDADAIAEALVLIGRPLPTGLVELYHLCNGGEGSLPVQPLNFVLWNLEFVVQTREDAHYREYFDRFVFFGTNGGGEYFGIDPDGRVFFMDPVAGEDSIAVMATTFDEFAALVGTPPME
jgi:hypothetical protein